MDFAVYENLLFKRRARVLEIILNRPERRNAIDAALHRELARIFTDAANDPDSDVLLRVGASAEMEWYSSKPRQNFAPPQVINSGARCAAAIMGSYQS